jgi:sugar phosphate isomerase/epimerase
MSKYFKINLDIGHFTAANFDAVAYLTEHHADITNLHIKDRKKNQGDNTPWGTATRRSARSCSSSRRTTGRSRRSSNTNTRARGRSKR